MRSKEKKMNRSIGESRNSQISKDISANIPPIWPV